MSALPDSFKKAAFKIEAIDNRENVVVKQAKAGLNSKHTSITSLPKRGIDVFVSAVALLFTLPFIVVIALAIRIQDGGKVLFVQERIGQDGNVFKCLKFRTMVCDAEARLSYVLENDPAARQEWNSMRKLTNDPRITWLGNFLRKSSLDELPQLFNVLRGDMSLVGPRPIVDAEIALYNDDFEIYSAVRPGISGLWQISGRSDVDFKQRVKLDKKYVEKWSFWLDLKIMFLTIPALLAQSGAR